MAYIGKIPATGAFQKCDSLNASATADYTLQVGSTNVVPESVNHMIVSLNGIIQEPGATGGFTVSGSTLSFTSTLTSNDTIDFVILLGNVLDVGVCTDDTVSTAKIQDDAVTTDKIANDAAISTSGAITTTGAFTSIGIDDNAAATAMTIDSAGKVLINTTDDLVYPDSSGDGGVVFRDNYLQLARTNAAVAYLNRIDDDGTIVEFYQAGNKEGDIAISTSTVSYNGFTGTHWSRFTDNSKPTILRGTVLETLDEMCDWYNLEFDVISTKKMPHVLTNTQSIGDTVTYNYKETDYQATIVKEGDVKHMKSKVSDTTDAKNVYGVFSAWDEDGEGYNDFYVASVGTYVVRIKSGETLTKGDLLQSNGDGTAKVQSDDNVKSSSFAKVLSTTIIETYDDGSFIVPCSLRC